MRRRFAVLIFLMLSVGLVATGGVRMTAAANMATRLNASQWQSPATIFSLGAGQAEIENLQIARDGHGDATVVWALGHYEAGTDAEMEAEWTATDGWTSPKILWTTPVPDYHFVSTHLAVNARGDAVLAWLDPASRLVDVAFRPAGQAWQAAHRLSLAGEPEFDPSVALDDQGRVLVALLGDRGPEKPLFKRFDLNVAARAPTGTWSRPKRLCVCDLSEAQLATTATGQALVVWEREASLQDQGLWAAWRSPSGRWTRPRKIEPLGDNLLVKLNDDGTAVAAWEQWSGPPPEAHLAVAIRPPHGPFGWPQIIGDRPSWGYDLALAPTGEAVVMWAPPDGSLHAMARLPGAPSFTSEQVLVPGDVRALEPAIGMDQQGNAVALWTKSTGNGFSGYFDAELYVDAAIRPAGGSFDAGSHLADMGPDGYKHSASCGESVASAADGNAIAVWVAGNGRTSRCTSVKAATYNP
jgi:hypothetical protein